MTPSFRKPDSSYFTDPLAVSASQIASDERFGMRAVATVNDVWNAFADEFVARVRDNNLRGRTTVVLLDQQWLELRPAAERCNRENLSLERTVIVQAFEFCDKHGHAISPDDPLSQRGVLQRGFVNVLRPELRPPPKNIVTPEPVRPAAAVSRVIDEGGAEVCYAAFGQNGAIGVHVPATAAGPDWFELPARVVCWPDDRLIAGAVTIGIGDILRAAAIRLYLVHGWQGEVLRRALYGEVTPSYPASILQRHPELAVVMTPSVAG